METLEANNNSIILVQFVIGFLYSIPTLFIIGICIYYLKKVGSKKDGILILVGNIIIFLSIISGKILMIQFVLFQKVQADMYSGITMAISALSFIGSILFVIGLFLLVKRAINKSLVS